VAPPRCDLRVWRFKEGIQAYNYNNYYWFRSTCLKLHSMLLHSLELLWRNVIIKRPSRHFYVAFLWIYWFASCKFYWSDEHFDSRRYSLNSPTVAGLLFLNLVAPPMYQFGRPNMWNFTWRRKTFSRQTACGKRKFSATKNTFFFWKYLCVFHIAFLMNLTNMDIHIY